MNDPREARTRSALRSALLALLCEKDFDRISISDLTHRANVARKTFYAHFRDKQDLLVQVIEDMLGQLRDQIGALNPDTLLSDGKPLTYPLFKHVGDHAELYRALLNSHSTAAVLVHLLTELAAFSYQAHAPLRQRAAHISVPPAVTAHHLAGALIGMLIWWLHNENTYTPEQMAYMFSQLAAPGVLGALGLDE